MSKMTLAELADKIAAETGPALSGLSSDGGIATPRYADSATPEQIAAAEAIIAASSIVAQRRYVSKLAIIDRLEAAGLLDAALAALASASARQQARWNAAQEIADDDPDAIAMLQSIGADHSSILC